MKFEVCRGLFQVLVELSIRVKVIKLFLRNSRGVLLELFEV